MYDGNGRVENDKYVIQIPKKTETESCPHPHSVRALRVFNMIPKIIK